MKKKILIGTTIMMLAALLAGCKSDKDEKKDDVPIAGESEVSHETTETTEISNEEASTEAMSVGTSENKPSTTTQQEEPVSDVVENQSTEELKITDEIAGVLAFDAALVKIYRLDGFTVVPIGGDGEVLDGVMQYGNGVTISYSITDKVEVETFDDSSENPDIQTQYETTRDTVVNSDGDEIVAYTGKINIQVANAEGETGELGSVVCYYFKPLMNGQYLCIEVVGDYQIDGVKLTEEKYYQIGE